MYMLLVTIQVGNGLMLIQCWPQQKMKENIAAR